MSAQLILSVSTCYHSSIHMSNIHDLSQWSCHTLDQLSSEKPGTNLLSMLKKSVEERKDLDNLSEEFEYHACK